MRDASFWSRLAITGQVAAFLCQSVQATDLNNTAHLYSRDAAASRQWASWTALGDGFASGPGVGSPMYGDSSACYRRSQAYPDQLQLSGAFTQGHGQPGFQFEACNGARTTDVLDSQVNHVGSGNTGGSVTLSTGMSDSFIASAMRQCLFSNQVNTNNPCFYNPSAYFLGLQEDIFSVEFNENYGTLTQGIANQIQWEPSDGTAVYQTAYPQYFDEFTGQCNGVIFGPAWYTSHPAQAIYLNSYMREQLNFLIQQLNALQAYWIDQANYFAGGGNVSFIIHANQDQRYNGHRFCGPGVNEPDEQNPNIWFFNLFSKGEQPDSDMQGSINGYYDLLGNACDTVSGGPGGDDDWTKPMACVIAQGIMSGLSGPYPNRDINSPNNNDALAKVFHPRTAGHQATRDEILRREAYIPGAKPTGMNLRILPIGDSITFGYRSTEESGYRKPLYDMLTASGNTVSFLGTLRSGNPPNAPWTPNEGYPSANSSVIHSAYAANAAFFNPNVVLLMAGTNDITEIVNAGENVDAHVAAHRALIDAAVSSNPNALILVGHVIAIGYADYTSQISAYNRQVVQWNARISAYVNRLAGENPGLRIRYAHTTVTVYEHWQDENGIDPLHPNDQGYVKIAGDWAQALSDAFDDGLIPQG